MRLALSFALILVLTGCVNSPLAYRGIVYQTIQEATTDGQIANNPKAGNATSNADKTLQDTLKVPAPEGVKDVDND